MKLSAFTMCIFFYLSVGYFSEPFRTRFISKVVLFLAYARLRLPPCAFSIRICAHSRPMSKVG